VPQSTIAKFAGTTNESEITKDSPVKSERAHYFDAGVTQKIAEGFNVGIDGFYKSAHSILDEGQFGEALILSSFNYKRGEIYGGEFTSSYDHGPFSAYLNIACEWARGTNVSSAQFTTTFLRFPLELLLPLIVYFLDGSPAVFFER